MTTVLMVDDSLARIVTRQRPGNIATPIGAVVSKRSPIDTRRDAGRLLMLYFALLRHSAQAAAFLGMSLRDLVGGLWSPPC